MAVIKSVQNGTATIASSSDSTTATVTGVTLANTYLVFSIRVAQIDAPSGEIVRGWFTGTTGLQFERSGSPATALVVEWFVVEFESGVTVQSGSAVGTAGRTPTITAVVLADSFLVFSTEKSGSTYGTDDLIKAWLTSTTALEFANSDGDHNGATSEWFVVESSSFDVQAGSLSMTSGTTADQTVTEVDLTATFPILSFVTDASISPDTDDMLLRGHFTTSTNLRAEREVDGADPGTDGIRWQVVEITDGTSVQSGTFAFADTDAQESATVTAVSNGSPFAAGFNQTGGQGSNSSGDTIAPAVATLDLTTSTNLQGDRTSTAGTADIEWFLVDWAASAGRYINYGRVSRNTPRSDADRLVSESGLLSARKVT